MESEDAVSMNRRIGARLLRRRTELGLSMAEVAAQLDISYQAYRRYENGEVAVSFHRILKLAKICSVPVLYFVDDGVAGDPGSKPQIVGPTDKKHAALLQVFENTIGSDSKMASSIVSLLPFIASQEGESLVDAYRKIDSPKVRKNIVALINSIAEALSTGK